MLKLIGNICILGNRTIEQFSSYNQDIIKI